MILSDRQKQNVERIKQTSWLYTTRKPRDPAKDESKISETNKRQHKMKLRIEEHEWHLAHRDDDELEWL